jgi:FkbM family methyltransferase
MKFVSHAQNFEDVMLWRCFGHLNSGFYVDIGADDPVIDSVTKSFYESGWTGINIDPTENSFTKLQVDRQRDINIQVAVAEHEGSIDFWSVPKTGLSTAVRKFADQHKTAGFEVNSISIKTRSLKGICEEFVKKPINFMKIDVEGFEKEVLSGADFKKFRPMVILIESTEPNSQTESHLEWENILFKNNYLYCYGDGLNRFYLSKESESLAVHFKYPPNVFDDFVLSKTSLFYDPNKFEINNTDLEKSNELINQSRLNLINQVNLSSAMNDYEKNRIKMTVSCGDSEAIPKVANAGELTKQEGVDIQLMHNGIKIIEGCYYGTWMTHIIEILRGHHEPQEEFAFFKLMEHLHSSPSPWGNPRMIELGSFWAYYSMWFLKDFPEGSTYCFEPDPNYLEIGRQNFELNNLSGSFVNAMVSDQASEGSEFRCESDGQVISVPALDFSGIIATTEQKEIDIILVDIQGAETPLLKNLSQVLQHSMIRFMVISTHDVEISGSTITHQSALDLLIQNGAHIILEHSVSESYSGDGFILASFMDVDKQLQIPISFNRSKNSLFGEWEPRMHKLQEELTQQNVQLTQERDSLGQQHEQLTREYEQLNQHQHGLLNSTNWRASKPLRIIVDLFKK